MGLRRAVILVAALNLAYFGRRVGGGPRDRLSFTLCGQCGFPRGRLHKFAGCVGARLEWLGQNNPAVCSQNPDLPAFKERH